MSNDNQKSSSLPAPALYVIGAIFMFGGAYVSTSVKLPFMETLAQKGLPIDLGMTIATIGVLMILFPLVNLFFIVPLAAAIHERNSNLERTFSEVEGLRDEMAKMKTDYEKRLAATEASAREQIQNQIKEAQALRQTLTAEATLRADALLEAARVQIEQETKAAILDLRSTVVDLTLGATEKLIGANMDEARNRRLIEDFINTVEVTR